MLGKTNEHGDRFPVPAENTWHASAASRKLDESATATVY
jgi:hypothetical protein